MPPNATSSASSAERARLRHLLELAREDVNVFAALCFRNDQPPYGPVEQQRFHREWQRAWSEERISVIHGATGIGKTKQITIHLLWRIGRNPNIRIAVIKKTAKEAEKTVAEIRRQIEENVRLKHVFPHLKAGRPWGDERLRVEGASIDQKDDTVMPYGIDGSPGGIRADVIVLDDVNDDKNARSEVERQQINEWVDGLVQSRLTTEGQIIILANAWHVEDLAFTYSRRKGVWYKAYPILEEATGALLWPSFWPMARVDRIRETMTPTTFARMYLCQPRDESTRVFRADWFRWAREKGRGLRPERTVERTATTRDGQLLDLADFDRIFTATLERRVVVGVDLATARSERRRKTDFTCFFVLGLEPNGDRRVLWIEKGRWPLAESIRRLADIERRYRPDRFIVETNGAQMYFPESARMVMGGKTPRIEEFDTTGEKWDEAFGIEGIGVEMQARRWALPSPTRPENEAAYVAELTPEEAEAYELINQWAQHLLDFTRGPHTPDDVMAGYFAFRGMQRLAAEVFQQTGEVFPRTSSRDVAEKAGVVATVGRVLGEPDEPPAGWAAVERAFADAAPDAPAAPAPPPAFFDLIR